MITLRFRFVEGGSSTHKFKTLAGAQKRAWHQVGESPSFGRGYAVDDYGCCTVDAIGCTLRELFPKGF